MKLHYNGERLNMQKINEIIIKTYEDAQQMLYVHLSDVFMQAQRGELTALACVSADSAFCRLSTKLQKKIAYEIDWFFGSFQCDGSILDFISRFVKRDSLNLAILSEFIQNYRFYEYCYAVPETATQAIEQQMPAIKCIRQNDETTTLLYAMKTEWFSTFSDPYLDENDIKQDGTVRDCLIYLNKSQVGDYNTMLLRIQQFCTMSGVNSAVIRPAVHFAILSSVWRSKSKCDFEGIWLYRKAVKEALFNVS